MNIPEYLNYLEKNLMIGSGRWVTDFVESFRDYTIGEKRFAMFLRGSTRTKQGFFLARFFAWTVLPDYKVACFITPQTEGLNKTVGIAEKYLAENELHWGWLIFPREGEFPSSLKNSIESISLRNLGVGLVNITAKQVTTSSNYLGRQMVKYVR